MRRACFDTESYATNRNVFPYNMDEAGSGESVSMHKRAFLFKCLFLTMISMMLFLLSPSRPGYGYEQEQQQSDSSSSKTERMRSDDPMELEVYLDEFINQKMEEQHIPGLIFVLVKDGEIFFSKGYGYADVEQKTPVEPDETIFRVGSVSKLFTATAAMQLHEQGKLDLSANVNNYLKLFKLEENYPKPVTMAHLLSHTAGFRGWAIGRFTSEASERIPLGEFLAGNMPPRSFPPASVINYSNHGFYLAGHLIEVVSGLPFDRYVAERILNPLGMTKSSFVMPDKLIPIVAKGYSYENGKYQAVPVEYPLPLSSPAGSLIATAEDMARFMMAHLQGGRSENQHILKESTCREMQQQQFSNDPRLPGTCYGFYEYHDYQQRGILHDGNVSGFASRLLLLPERNFGFFVCNNIGNSLLRRQLTDHLLSRYFSRQEESPPSETSTDIQSLGKRLAGSYRPIRLGLDTFDKLSYTGAVLTITEETVSSLIEIEPGLFQFPESNTRVAFREDAQGNVQYLFLDAQQMPITYEKLPWYENGLRFPRVWFGLFATVFLWIGIIRPVFNTFRAKRKPPTETTRLVRYTKLAAAVIGAIYLIFIAGFTPAFLLSEDKIVFGVPWVIKALLVLPIINLVLTAVFTVLLIMTWKNEYWDSKKRFYYLAAMLLFIGFALHLNYWNLLGFQY
jgi:CubicO group peptidase (beta-lactamase class C family)